MTTLQSGMLLRMLEHMHSDFKVAGEYRSVLLQVIGIVPALAGKELWPKLGFHVRVSDLSHSMYVSLSPEDDDSELVLSGKLQLGQFLHVERLEPGSPFPRLVGIKPFLARNATVSNVEELSAKVIQIPQRCITELISGHGTTRSKMHANTGRDRRKTAVSPVEGLPSKWELRTPVSTRKGNEKRVSVQPEKHFLNGPYEKSTQKQAKFYPVFSENHDHEGNKLSGRKISEKFPDSMCFDKKQACRNPSPRVALKVHSPSRTNVLVDDPLPRHKAFLFEKTPLKGHPRSNNGGQNTYRRDLPSIANGSLERRAPVGREGSAVPSRCRHAPSSTVSSRKDSPLNRNVGDRVTTRFASTGKAASYPSVSTATGTTVKTRSTTEHIPERSVRKSWDRVPVSVSRQSLENVETKCSSGLQATSKKQNAGPRRITAIQHSSPQVRKGATEQVCPTAPSVKQESSTFVSGQKLPTIHHRKWTDESVSWDGLSSSTAALAKDVLSFRKCASLAAAQALQEASAAESVIRNVSIFAELSSSSRPEFPRESMQKYFALCSSLRKVTTISDALVKTCESENLPGNPSPPKVPDEAHNICTERLRSAGSWVAAALSTDLASFSSYEEPKVPSRSRLSILGSTGQQAMEAGIAHSAVSRRSSPSPSRKLPQPSPNRVAGRMNPSVTSRNSTRRQVTDHENRLPQTEEKRLVVSSHNRKSRITEKDARQLVSMFDKGLHFDDTLFNKWVQGQKVIWVAELARQLQCEAQRWFFKYMEEALDCGFHFSKVHGSMGTEQKVSKDGMTLALAFPQLKQMNDWIGQLDLETLDSHMLEVLDRLKKTIRVFLLQHVEAASSRLRQSI